MRPRPSVPCKPASSNKQQQRQLNDAGQSALWLAASGGDLDAVRRSLEYGLDQLDLQVRSHHHIAVLTRLYRAPGDEGCMV